MSDEKGFINIDLIKQLSMLPPTLGTKNLGISASGIARLQKAIDSFKTLPQVNSQLASALPNFLNINAINSLAMNTSEMERIRDLSSPFKGLAPLGLVNAIVFNKAIGKGFKNYYDVSSAKLLDRNEAAQEIDELLEDEEIVKEISSDKDFNEFSSPAKKVIFFFLQIILQTLFVMFQPEIVELREYISGSLGSEPTTKQVKKIARSLSNEDALFLLKGYRISIADVLNVRQSASQKSSVIFQIPNGTLLNVLDKSGRSWILIEAEIDGDKIEGWVSRKYTTYFR